MSDSESYAARKSELARSLFMEGLNCSQAVAVVFADEMNMPVEQAKRLTIGFGGGMSRLREVCGAVSGMTFVISALYAEPKASVYKRVQAVAKEYEAMEGSIVCRELLGLSKPGADSPVPEERTAGYYKKRPCPNLVADAAGILARYVAENPSVAPAAAE